MVSKNGLHNGNKDNRVIYLLVAYGDCREDNLLKEVHVHFDNQMNLNVSKGVTVQA